MSTHKWKANIMEFYAVVFPSLVQLGHGISNFDDRRQRNVCSEKYRRRQGRGEQEAALHVRC